MSDNSDISQKGEVTIVRKITATVAKVMTMRKVTIDKSYMTSDTIYN